MKLQKEFMDFYSEIRIDSETNWLIEKREILQSDIMRKLPDIFADHGLSLNKSDIRMIDQGSYKYKTTIKGDVVDRDIAVILPLDIAKNSDPRKIKGYLRDSITIPSRNVTIKEPCVRASYFEGGKEKLHVDLPLYACDGGRLFLARGKMNSDDYSWEDADPEGLVEYICKRLNGNNQLRRIICYLKKWRDEKYFNASSDHEIPPSIGLTLLACKCFSPVSTEEGEYDLLSLQKTFKAILNLFDVVKDVNGNIVGASISQLLPVVPYSDVFVKMKERSSTYLITFFKRIEVAVNVLTNAVNVESAHDAGEYVRKVLGMDFSVPEKEAVRAEALSRREHNFGE